MGTIGCMSSMIFQINIKVREAGERGIPKQAVQKAHVRKTGLIGDYNRYRDEKLEGDLDSAVLLLPVEIINGLQTEGWKVQPGDLGENVTTKDISGDSIGPGTRLMLGSDVMIEISRPCRPCSNLQLLPYVGAERLRDFMKTLKDRRGWYARVIREGIIFQGDPITQDTKGLCRPHKFRDFCGSSE